VTTQTTVYGEIDVAAGFPTMVSLIAAMDADAAARLAGALAVSGEVAVNLPTLEGMIEAFTAVSAQITAGGVSLNFAVQADIIASLKLMITAMAALTVAFGEGAKAEVFGTTGPASEFSGACNAQVGAGIQGGSPTDQVQSIVIVTRYPAFIAAFLKVFLA
jgi:hypothetical protein